MQHDGLNKVESLLKLRMQNKETLQPEYFLRLAQPIEIEIRFRQSMPNVADQHQEFTRSIHDLCVSYKFAYDMI